jgi:hypothetical protein
MVGGFFYRIYLHRQVLGLLSRMDSSSFGTDPIIIIAIVMYELREW